MLKGQTNAGMQTSGPQATSLQNFTTCARLSHKFRIAPSDGPCTHSSLHIFSGDCAIRLCCGLASSSCSLAMTEVEVGISGPDGAIRLDASRSSLDELLIKVTSVADVG